MSNRLERLSLCKKNKKAQVGGTMTWFVATLIIVFVLIISIYASSFLGKAKSLSSDSEDLDAKEGRGRDWIDVKNSEAFEKNSSDEEKIRKWLNNSSISEDS